MPKVYICDIIEENGIKLASKKLKVIAGYAIGFDNIDVFEGKEPAGLVKV